MANTFYRKLKITLAMIKFEHSIFALPFALTGAMLAVGGRPGGRELAWIVLAMVAARSAAMTFNRIADASLDARNPRTASRPLPKGRLSMRFAAVFTAAASGVFFLAAAELHPWALKLSPLALLILFGYSYTKRFTYLSHLWLGFSLGMSPVGAAVALTGPGGVTAEVILLGVAVMFWVAGFDLIYSCQDLDFDRGAGLYSFPQRFGVRAALLTARIFHVIMMVVLVWVARYSGLGWLSAIGLFVVGLLLLYEHSLVKPNDLSRVNAAFFAVNGIISLLFFAFWAGDIGLLHTG